MNKGWHGEEIRSNFDCRFWSMTWIEKWNRIAIINRGCNELETLNGDGYNARGN